MSLIMPIKLYQIEKSAALPACVCYVVFKTSSSVPNIRTFLYSTKIFFIEFQRFYFEQMNYLVALGKN
ncbi:MAG: hypothetical protein AMXMBFR79_11200 [Chitinophagaceae bacterium]